MRVLGDKVIVIRDEPDEVTEGGIIMPKSGKEEKPDQGVVVAVGPESGVTEGETVVFGKYSGVEFTVDGEKFLAIRAGDIMVLL